MVGKTAASLVILLPLAIGAAHAIDVNGRLDEPEWAQAQVFSDFRVTEPFTRAPANYATELRVLALPDALYVGLRAEHPPDQRTHGRSPRDAPNMDADPAILIIDFEGLGKTAYEFTVTISGAKRDSIILNQTDLSRDWDADWQATTYEDARGWSAEWRIPWSVGPEGAVHGDKRTIGIYAGRYLKHDAVRFAFPAIELFEPNFVRDFQHIEVPRYPTSSLDWYPYVSLAHDTLSGVSRGRAGFDVFWKPNGRNQLSAAVNPDFGQVESDNLVVNFSAIETFFQEKRPFFTQGQQLFDLRLNPIQGDNSTSDRLVNTRRIGAAPDAGPEPSSDVLAAAKYTGIQGDEEYGLFSAVERDSLQAEGRRFFAGRWRHEREGFSLGYLGTGALHPTLGRDAYVHAVDLNKRLGNGISLETQALMSDIRMDSAAAGASSRGYGAWAKFDYQPGRRWQHTLHMTWFDPHLDFNDLGYQQRTDLARFQSESSLFIRHYRTGSLADNGSWFLGLDVPYTAHGERLVATTEIDKFYQWRNGSSSLFFYFHEWPGFDDLLTRGNGSLRMPPRHNWGADFTSAVVGRFRYEITVYLKEQGFGQYTKELRLVPKWFLTENLSVDSTLNYYDSPNWLLWTSGRHVATYRRHELDSSLNVNWYPTSKQELRFKLQWIGLGAEALQAYDLAADGTPIAVAGLPSDFTVSTLGVQLRYRYEFRPLSDLFVVYSRGGDGSLADRSESLASQFTRAVNNVNSSLFFVKLRYRI
jgi:hypothetical protein